MKIISRDQDIASVLIEWGWSHYSRVQGEGVGTEQKLCLTSTSEWKVIFWIEIYHGSFNINRKCLNSGEYIGRGGHKPILSIYGQIPEQYFAFWNEQFVECHVVLVEVYLRIKPILCISKEKKLTVWTECVMLHLILACISVEESVSLGVNTIIIASEEKYHIEKLYN